MASIISAGTTSGTALNMTADTSGQLQLATNSGTTAVTIGTSQNVGIGTTTVDAGEGKLNIASSTSPVSLHLFYGTNGDNYLTCGSSGIQVFRTGSTERMRITSGGYLKASNTGTYVNSTGAFHELYSTGQVTEVLIVRSENASYTGDVLFVDVNRNTTNNSFYAINYYNRAAAAYRFRVADSGNVTNTNNSYGAISDVKLKENIVDATPKLDKLNQVRVVNYNLIGEEQKQLGVIAQELEQIFPSMIDESPDLDKEGNELGTTTKSVKYSVFVPMLIKSIQEQQTIINDLKARIETLEGAKS
jgi:hypothetical protein